MISSGEKKALNLIAFITLSLTWATQELCLEAEMLTPFAKLWLPPAFQAMHPNSPGLGFQHAPCPRRAGPSYLLFSLKMTF